VDLFSGARMLLADASVEAAVVAINDTRFFRTGAPFDRCSDITLACSCLVGVADEEAKFHNLPIALLPMAKDGIVVDAGSSACQELLPHVPINGAIPCYKAGRHFLVAQHRATRGVGVWVESMPDGLRLVIASGADEPFKIRLAKARPRDQMVACNVADVVFASSVARALGCHEGHLKLGLAKVLLRSKVHAASAKTRRRLPVNAGIRKWRQFEGTAIAGSKFQFTRARELFNGGSSGSNFSS
jgi:hypothetical protein